MTDRIIDWLIDNPAARALLAIWLAYIGICEIFDAHTAIAHLLALSTLFCAGVLAYLPDVIAEVGE